MTADSTISVIITDSLNRLLVDHQASIEVNIDCSHSIYQEKRNTVVLSNGLSGVENVPGETGIFGPFCQRCVPNTKARYLPNRSPDSRFNSSDIFFAE